MIYRAAETESPPSGFLEGSLFKEPMFHGSPKRLGQGHQLRPDQGSEYGIYVTPRARYARMYGNNIHKVLVRAKNPFVVDGKHEISAGDITKEDIEKLEGQGYDSIVVTSGGIAQASEIVLFHQKQVWVMSITGTNRMAGMGDIGFSEHDGERFWGNAGSGILFTTGEKILILKRSSIVQEPGTWGIPGGAIPEDTGRLDDPMASAKREVKEEVGQLPSFSVKGKTVFKKGNFTFTTFIGKTDEEFKPRLNWENSDWAWVTEDELSDYRLHFGLKYTLGEANPFDRAMNEKVIARELIRAAKDILSSAGGAYLLISKELPPEQVLGEFAGNSVDIWDSCDFSAHSNNDYCYEVSHLGRDVRIYNRDSDNRKNLLKYLSLEEIEKIPSWDMFDILRKKMLGDKDVGCIWYNDDKWGIISKDQIVSIKLIKSKSEFEDDAYPEEMAEELSDNALSWLSRFMSKAGGGKPSSEVVRELKKFRLNRPVKIYRGMGWHEGEMGRLESFSYYPFEVGSVIGQKYERPASWTTNRLIAEEFAKNTGEYWIVLEYTANTDDVLVDTRMFPPEVLKKLYNARQREVILRQGIYRVRIEKIGFKEDGSLKTGWEPGLVEDWGEVARVFQKLQMRLGENWSFGLPRQHYGYPGIKSSKTFNERNAKIIVIENGREKEEYILQFVVWRDASPGVVKMFAFPDLTKLTDFLNSLSRDDVDKIFIRYW